LHTRNLSIDLASTGTQLDRLSSTVFVAALAHGIVILGVTFAPPLTQDRETRALNVTLLVDTETLETEAPDTDLLSSRNQAGGGDDEGTRPTRTLTAAQPMNQSGEPLGVDTRTAEALAAATPADRLVTRSPSTRSVEAVPETTDRPAPVPMTQAALLQQSAPETLAAELDTEVVNAAHNEAEIDSPNTRDSALAAYVFGWKQRVERVGTAHFPAAFLDGAASPRVEVTIDADGHLKDVVFVRSSGNTNLDQATLEILSLAGPFDPLPEAILAEASSVQFEYEWHFKTGAQAASRVR
jgi:periplasmic protein TonB